jgi:hypothetical protein
VFHNGGECLQQFPSGGLQFFQVRQSHIAQNFDTACGQLDHHGAAVGCGARAANEAFFFEAVEEFDGAVMLNLQAFG